MRPQRRNKRQKLFCAFHVRKPSMSGVTFLSLIIPLPPLYVKAAARARPGARAVDSRTQVG